MTQIRYITVQRYGKSDVVLQRDGSTFKTAEGRPACRLSSYTVAAIHWLLMFNLPWEKAHLGLNRTASGQYVHHAVLKMEDAFAYLIPAGCRTPIPMFGQTYDEVIAMLRRN